ncbi:hypothetical protein LTR17_016957 [Elasticomyces elasticus]|nr:hypothetical protein LTR17_016957 [Elasticomyces elasticus]
MTSLNAATLERRPRSTSAEHVGKTATQARCDAPKTTTSTASTPIPTRRGRGRPAHLHLRVSESIPHGNHLYSEDQHDEIIRLRNAGHSWKEIARAVGSSVQAVSEYWWRLWCLPQRVQETVLTEHEKAKIALMRDEGRTRFEIAREIQRSLSTVSNILKVMGKTSKVAGSKPWLPEDDKKLIRAREASVSYKDIAKQILPGRSLKALYVRHHRIT